MTAEEIAHLQSSEWRINDCAEDGELFVTWQYKDID